MFLADDNACRAIAEEIQQQRPGWLIIWGIYTRRYTACRPAPQNCRALMVRAGSTTNTLA
jgi:hypothetical protein